MEMNVWWVAKELACRIEGAPVFSEYIHSFVTEKPSDAFFLNREYQVSENNWEHPERNARLFLHL